MDDEPQIDIAALRRDRPLEVALWGPQSLVGRIVTWVFVFASACHLWLADAWQLEWLFANVVYLVGLALLCWRKAAVGWLLSAVGLAIPLFFHRDQLTQSLILLLFASTAGFSLIFDALRQTAPATTDSGTSGRQDPADMRLALGEWTFLSVFRGVTVVTYLLAVLHKINREFLDPQYSCAVYGLDELFTYWNLPLDVLPMPMMQLAPWLVLLAEGGIALFYLLGRRHVAWTLMAAFHIPLTLTMAPAFVFVMLVGHAAFLRLEDVSRLRAVLARHWPILGMTAALLTTASLLAHNNLPEWTMIPREWLLWGLLLTLSVAFPLWKKETWRPDRAPHPKPPRRTRLWPVVAVVGFFALNGLTPYLGVQYQHAGAMVSNLRIDRGCWNSLVFPESVRLTEDYIRVEETYFAEPGHIVEYEQIVLEQLWSPPQFRQMRRNWCRDEVRPFYLRGTFRGREFVIEDLCAGEPLPFADAGVFGVEIFGDYLRFQKNLERECPQTCIH
ncbi:hypothetical protein FIV42_21650 [Persicimonas caeni]|uniref:HTTM domain-containing protein n=1 Tax=Persicimonas caeni TaxID=2292766 RepID=A0A4Y6PY51_PERCE|nr:hypothetical protein [Persicimonas caeni]QDG53254.1 hypothetical protein FIV42_21650 [Persicimonas caeni]QED34476.1 hypothetical protein FRD00_21645 [Persicimonas caeni]